MPSVLSAFSRMNPDARTVMLVPVRKERILFQRLLFRTLSPGVTRTVSDLELRQHPRRHRELLREDMIAQMVAMKVKTVAES